MAFRLALGVLLATPLFTSAVFIPTLGSSLDVSIFPEFPRAGEAVTLRAENIANGAGATYVWRVNGSVIDQGIGVRAITITAGGLGSETIVSVSASENGSVVGEKTILIHPADVDIVWEGNTYTPPFLPLRPLPNPSSSVKLLAVPHIVRDGARAAASDLVYTWRINRSQAPVASGYGRNVITATPPQFANAFEVSVVAATRDGAVQAEGVAVIRPAIPEVVIYENAPLLGIIFEKAVGDEFVLKDTETSFSAFPLYVASADAPEYEWRLNGNAVSGNSPRDITFRREGEGGGVYTVEFSLQNALALFERVATKFSLRF